MPAEIRYKNSVIATVAAGESKFLDCYGKEMASNVVVTLPEGYVIPKGGLSITANGTHDVTDKASVAVNVPIPDGYIKPSGTLSIAENGTHDVTDKASVAVNVPIPDGYIKPSGTLSIAENGTHDVVDFVSVEVNVEPALQEKTVAENGDVTPDEGYDGLSKVTVNVPIPDGYIKPEGTLEITTNGSHTVTNYTDVTVNVPSKQPQLYAPNATITDDVLTIEDNTNNGAFTTGYDVYINGEIKASVIKEV